MKKTIVLVLFALMLCAAASASEDAGIMGRPFPDFTVTDTQGNTFVLSEMLKDHEAVLINCWATWCAPCGAEFPFLNAVYGEYGDRVAFIALSAGSEDTPEKIEAYREAHGISFPMGRDEGEMLYRHMGGRALPSTAIVDRFGNTVFFHLGSFSSAGEIARVLDVFLGEDYTETTVLERIPSDTATCAYPVSAVRAIHVDNENARQIEFRAAGEAEPLTAYVIEDDTAHLRIEAAAADNPAEMIYFDQNRGKIMMLPELLDTERGVYTYDQPMPAPGDSKLYSDGYLMKNAPEGDPDGIAIYLIPGSARVEEFAEFLRASGYDISWKYVDAVREENGAAQAYVLRIIDQTGAPVPGVFVNFCTDTACTMLVSDENGMITFDGEPDKYHIQLYRVPEGYSYDAGFDMYTGRTYAKWVMRIRKD